MFISCGFKISHIELRILMSIDCRIYSEGRNSSVQEQNQIKDQFTIFQNCLNFNYKQFMHKCKHEGFFVVDPWQDYQIRH